MTDPLPDNYDPDPDKREWWRNNATGEKGYLVRRNGVEKVRLDRPQEEILRSFKGNAWTIDRDLKPLMLHTEAQMCHVIDQKLLVNLGYHDEADREWHELSEPERIRFMREGQQGLREQDQQFDAIMKVLEPLTK